MWQHRPSSHSVSDDAGSCLPIARGGNAFLLMDLFDGGKTLQLGIAIPFVRGRELLVASHHTKT